jgi:nitroreductase
MLDDNGATTPVGYFDVVLKQRATRQFTDQPVSDELLDLCLRAATHAPSAENLQPWLFVVVRDPGIRAGIGDLTRRAWRQGGRQHSEGRLSESLLREVDQGAEGGVESAPVIVVVCGDASIGLEVTLPSSVFLATQNLLLSATALGLGSAMTTLATLFADDLRQLLELPATARPMASTSAGERTRLPGPLRPPLVTGESAPTSRPS